MKKKVSKSRKSVGTEIVEDFENLLASLKRGDRVENTFTVRNVKLNLRPTEYTSRTVRQTRTKLGVSQAIFAELLGISTPLVQGWEQGARVPNAMACRLLDDINRDPSRWLDILRHAMAER